MLGRTRVSRAPDVQRLAAALRGPGTDTRCWVSLAVALEDSAVDQEQGVFVDVRLMPTEENYTARVPSFYAGNGFGFYAKILKDDELLVAAPSGDPAEGIVVVQRLWSAADKPPQRAADFPDEVLLVVEAEKNLRITTAGAGNVQIDSAGTVVVNCPDVRLGEENPTDPVAREPPTITNFNTIKQAMQNAAVLAGDGGATLKTNFIAQLDLILLPNTYPLAIASQTTKAK